MKLTLQRADEFNADFEQQYRWYADHAGEEIAERFLRAVADTLPRLAALPVLGRRRKFAIQCCPIYIRFKSNVLSTRFSFSNA